MASDLASIFGTEKDKVNCPFFFKIGACRHGEKCARLHLRPTISQSILLLHMYSNPFAGLTAEATAQLDPAQVQQDFEDFYEDVLEEMKKFGEVEEMHVCDNLGDHMVGNVYVKFASEESAQKALSTLTGRFYAGRPLFPEFTPVTDFREARCRQYDLGECTRGGFCNFLHLKKIPRDLEEALFPNRRGFSRHHRSRSRSHSRSRSRSRSRGHDRGHHSKHSSGSRHHGSSHHSSRHSPKEKSPAPSASSTSSSHSSTTAPSLKQEQGQQVHPQDQQQMEEVPPVVRSQGF